CLECGQETSNKSGYCSECVKPVPPKGIEVIDGGKMPTGTSSPGPG
ncbi:hypothetical protein LCGC14_1996110, partial [marine sediment metagenome]